MNETHISLNQSSNLNDPDGPIGLHPLFLGLECCPAQVLLNDGSLETIVVIRAQGPIEHHVVKLRHGTYPLNPLAEIQLLEILSDAA